MKFLQILVFLACQVLLGTSDDGDDWFRAVEAGNTAAVKQILSQNGEGVLLKKFGSFETTAIHIASKYGYTDVLEVLINSSANVEATSSDGCTALHYGARYAQGEVVQILIKAGAKLESTDNEGWTALHYAARYAGSEVLQILIDAGADIEATQNADWTALFAAAYNCSTDKVQTLVNAGANLDVANSKRWTALHYSARYCSKELVRALVNAGASLDAKQNDEWTALILATYIGSIDNVQILVDGGADLDAADEEGWTALHFAAKYGPSEIVLTLVNAGANLESKQIGGWTALPLAAINGSSEKVAILVDAKANLEATNVDGWTALHVAARYAPYPVLRLLVDAGANLEAKKNDGWTALILAAFVGSGDAVQKLVNSGANVEATTDEGWNALHMAARYDQTDALLILVEAGANIETTNGDGWTVLQLAARYASSTLVQFLIERGANIEATEATGLTALHLAASNGSSDVVQVLVGANANIEARKKGGWTALLLAGATGLKDVMRILMDAGANLEAANDDGWTVLLVAAQHAPEGVVQMLIDAGANLKVTDKRGWSALQIAARYSTSEVVKTLVDAGANVDATNHDGMTALHLAAFVGSSSVVQILVDAKANLEATNADGWTALLLAAYGGSSDVVQVLVDSKANLEATNADGWTALRLAAYEGSIDVVKVLVKASAKSDATENLAQAALQYAAENGHFEVVLLLIDAGARIDIVQMLADLNIEQKSDFIHKLITSKTVLTMAVKENNVDDIEFLFEIGKEIEIYNSAGAKTSLYWALLNSSMEVLLMDDINWNAQLQYYQSIFSPNSNQKVVLETAELPIADATEKTEVESNVHQDQQQEVVYCNNLTPGLKRFASGIDITTLDLFPVDSTKTDGFKKPLLDYTCNNGRTWKDDDNVYDIPDQIDSLQRVPTSWTHANTEIFQNRTELKTSMAKKVHLTETKETNVNIKIPKFSFFGLDIGSFHLKLYETKGSFSRTNSVRQMSEKIEQNDVTIAIGSSFISIYKAIIDTDSHLEPNQPLRSSIDKLPLSVLDYYNMQLYLNFIEEYGTHYFTEAKFGGYLRHISEIDSTYARSHNEEHLKEEESNFFRKRTEWTSNEHSKSTEKSSDQSTSVVEFEKHVKDQMYFFGGDPKAKNLDWFDTVSESPWLFSGKLEPIYSLIKDEQKQESMKRALLAYMKNARASELGPRLDAELCAFAFGDGCSAPRENCARVNQWSVPVTFREGTGSQCRMNWKLKVTSPDNWIEQRVKLCFKYSANINSNCSGSDYHSSWRIETPGKIKTLLSGPSTEDNETKALISCADVNDWTSNYIHYNGQGCTMTWSMFAVGDEDNDIPEWMTEFFFCWQALTFQGSYKIDCAPVVSSHLSHFYRDQGHIEGRQMAWGIFAQDLSTES